MQVSVPECENIIRLIADVVEAYTVALIHCNRSRSRMSCLCHHSLSKHFQAEKIVPFEKSGLLAQIITVQQMTHCDKLENKPIHSVMPFYSEEENLIKAFCMFPVSKWNGVLYVDTKHKWSFSRKELMWMQHGVALISDALKNLEARVQRDDYAELLTFFYAIDHSLDSFDNTSQDSLQDILDRTSRFIKADYGFLVSRKSPAGEIALEGVTSSAESFLRKRISFSGTLIEHTFEKRQPVIVFHPSLHGREISVINPGEALGRDGYFYGFYEKTHDSEWVMAFVSQREGNNIGSDHIYGVRRAFRLLLGEIERDRLRRECDFKTLYDPLTGFLNSRAFQMALQQKFQQAVSQNTSLALVIIQWEPYLTLCTLTTPELLMDWTRQIALALRSNLLAPEMTAGVLGENRIGIILSDPDQVAGHIAFARQSEHFLTSLELGKRLKQYLRFYAGTAVYPHDVAHIPEMWNRAYTSLLERMRSSNGRNSATDEAVLSDDEALKVLTSSRRTLRA
ncbi:GGDEF domain-containing protein, diguanylate cyclase (c-di-GMP synthetase) or its enzymatically inactive variants [Thermodesulforhabdus norvegica]|uniref:GGDEF domain-containing protein, diguanylate cyclase (C-di-GMP synthetase) or its enzymatically inactive variants n=1 Tax=Thermodesulforhabdus norvegica TaxID=39841 RepID=A0A1I4VXZ4_9BACT|nr:GGDEF domain-containing protein [Thermodesulforhabdus norvegica]SFN06158.1 GGDEF domain-containing protein, diguanylate cyclase (c-di-GMP synthetase) or its enzymatically inactive variants [Thermodesulforhabdus norvegica]